MDPVTPQKDPNTIPFGPGLPANFNKTCPEWDQTYEGNARGYEQRLILESQHGVDPSFLSLV